MSEKIDLADAFIHMLVEAHSKHGIGSEKLWEQIPDDINPQTATKAVVTVMLRENTGTHMLDSGGDSGRHWQQNQSTDFENQPSLWWDGYCLTKSTYHHIVENATYDKELDKQFHEYAAKNEGYWLENMEGFFKDILGIKAYTENTYNGENILSQILQYTIGRNESIMILQIHNGADVRGGYTTPHVFKIDGDCFYMISDANISCKCKWGAYTDDGYHWYGNNNHSYDKGDYKLADFHPNDIIRKFIDDYNDNLSPESPKLKYTGLLELEELDKFLYCPRCGNKLNVSGNTPEYGDIDPEFQAVFVNHYNTDKDTPMMHIANKIFKLLLIPENDRLVVGNGKIDKLREQLTNYFDNIETPLEEDIPSQPKSTQQKLV